MVLSFIEEFKNIYNLTQAPFEENLMLDKLIKKLANITNSNVLLICKDGYLIKEILVENFSLLYKNPFNNKVYMEEQVVTQLDFFKSLQMNISLDVLCTSLASKSVLKRYYSILCPIFANNCKIGTIIVYKKEQFQTDIEPIIYYLVSLISLILHYKNVNKINVNENNKNIVKSAISTLSYSELEALIHIFNEIDQEESVIIASKIADKFNITRSVIVNALRKLESAGIFETRSLGVKGTFIKVVNPEFFTEINKFKK